MYHCTYRRSCGGGKGEREGGKKDKKKINCKLMKFLKKDTYK